MMTRRRSHNKHLFPYRGPAGTTVRAILPTRSHPAAACANGYCAIHRQSNHPLRQAPRRLTLYYTPATTPPAALKGEKSAVLLMQRECTHGLWHPDPDDLAYIASGVRPLPPPDVHPCDGCCGIREQTGIDPYTPENQLRYSATGEASAYFTQTSNYARAATVTGNWIQATWQASQRPPGP